MQLRAFLGGLAPNVTEHDVQGRFQPFSADIQQVDIIRDELGACRGFGYVSMSIEEDLWKKCLKTFNGTTWKGHVMRIEEAKQDYKARLARDQEQPETKPETKPLRNVYALPTRHAKDMQLVTDKTCKDKKNWRKMQYGRAVRVMRMRMPSDPAHISVIDPIQYKPNIRKLKADEDKVDRLSVLNLSIEYDQEPVPVAARAPSPSRPTFLKKQRLTAGGANAVPLLPKQRTLIDDLRDMDRAALASNERPSLLPFSFVQEPEESLPDSSVAPSVVAVPIIDQLMAEDISTQPKERSFGRLVDLYAMAKSKEHEPGSEDEAEPADVDTRMDVDDDNTDYPSLQAELDTAKHVLTSLLGQDQVAMPVQKAKKSVVWKEPNRFTPDFHLSKTMPKDLAFIDAPVGPKSFVPVSVTLDATGGLAYAVNTDLKSLFFGEQAKEDSFQLFQEQQTPVVDDKPFILSFADDDFPPVVPLLPTRLSSLSKVPPPTVTTGPAATKNTGHDLFMAEKWSESSVPFFFLHAGHTRSIPLQQTPCTFHRDATMTEDDLKEWLRHYRRILKHDIKKRAKHASKIKRKRGRGLKRRPMQ